MAPATDLRVLVVDDDADTRLNLTDILELDGYQVTTADSIAALLSRSDWECFLAIILDRRLPDGMAEDLLPQLKSLAPEAAIIIVTGYSDLQGAIAALRQGAADYILKPINPDLIRSRLAGLAERRRAAEEIRRLDTHLQRRVEEMQTLLDVIPIGIAITDDPACQRIRVNPALARLLRLVPDAKTEDRKQKAETRKDPVTLSLPSAFCLLPSAFRFQRSGVEVRAEELPLHRAARGEEVRETDFDVVHPDGTTVHLTGYAAPLLDEAGRPRGAVGAFLDITERKKEQERALQTERLAAIGQMVTGLAHESGNALARSQSCLEMLAWEVAGQPEALDLIARIQTAQDHLKFLYEEVRGYAAPVVLERGWLNLGKVWRQSWKNLALERPPDAVLREHINGVDLSCQADLFRLDQVFRNILENALIACRGGCGEGGPPVRIDIRCHETTVSGRPALSISLQDNGPGLTVEQKQRIFEPFYTTRTKGTGLGMAIVRRIVEAHGGQIAVGPALGGGAEIVLLLPREAP